MNDQISGTEGRSDTQEGNASERDYTAEASKYGWIPEAEFKAKRPDRHAKTAEEFVKDLDRIEERLSPRVQKMLDERTSRLDRAYKAVTQIQERQFQEDLASIRTAQKAAAKDGNDKEFDRLEDEKTKLIKQGPDAQPPANPNEAFKARNDWYETDEDLTDYAIGVSNTLVAKWAKEHNGDQMPIEQMLDETEKKVKASKLFKDKFDKSAAPSRARVDGGSENGGGEPSGRKKGWSDLPSEAKKAYRGFDPKITKSLTEAKYAEQYWSDE